MEAAKAVATKAEVKPKPSPIQDIVRRLDRVIECSKAQQAAEALHISAASRALADVMVGEFASAANEIKHMSDDERLPPQIRERAKAHRIILLQAELKTLQGTEETNEKKLASLAQPIHELIQETMRSIHLVYAACTAFRTEKSGGGPK